MDFFPLRTSTIGQYEYTRMFVFNGIDIQIKKKKKKGLGSLHKIFLFLKRAHICFPLGKKTLTFLF